MKNYKLKIAIPTESTAKGLICLNDDIYFASNIHVYKYSRPTNSYEIFCTVKGTIVSLIKSNFFYVSTKERIYMINADGRIIGSLKNNATCMSTSSCNNLLAVGVGNILEIWNCPREFSFTLFKLHSRNVGHYNELTSINFLDSKNIITTSKDFTTRIFNSEFNFTKIICNHKSTPIRTHILEDKTILIVCDNGNLIYMKPIDVTDESSIKDSIEVIHKVFIDKKITSSAYNNGDLLLSTENNSINSLVFMKGYEIMENIDLKHNIDDLEIISSNMNDKHSIVIKGGNYIGILNYMSSSLNWSLDLPKILSMENYGDILFLGCSDRKIRVYNLKRQTMVMEDPDVKDAYCYLHCVRGMLVGVTSNGHISAFDTNNGYCFRSFKIDCNVSSSSLNDNGALLFVGDIQTFDIKVIDLKKSKQIDTLNGHLGVVKSLYFIQNSLFSVSYDNSIRKWSVYNSSNNVLQMDKTVFSLSLGKRVMCVSTDSELSFYDLNLNFIKSIGCKIKGRKRNEKFSSDKPVTQMTFSFDDSIFFAAGESNYVKAYQLESGFEVQELKVSKNKEMENYKKMLGRESDEPFDPEKVIEVLDIKCSDTSGKIFIMSREGVNVYEVEMKKLDPIDLEYEITPESIKNEIDSKNFLGAVLTSIKLGDQSIIIDAIKSTPIYSIETVIRHFPRKLIPNLKAYVTKMIEKNILKVNCIHWIKWMIYYHEDAISNNTEKDLIKGAIREILDVANQNYYMMLNIKNKKK